MHRIITSLGFLLFFQLLNAQVFVDADAVGSNDGTSWQNAYTDLQDGIDNANGQDIWLAAGVYTPGGAMADSSSSFNVTQAVAIYGGFNGSETAFDQRNTVLNVSILSGDINGDDTTGDFEFNRQDNSIHVMLINTIAGGTTTIDGITLRGGNSLKEADFDDANLYRGGGIYTRTPLVINDCILTDNFGDFGGAIAYGNTIGNSVTNTSISNNRAQRGAAVYISNGGIAVGVRDTSNFLFSNCEINDNYATARAGGIYNFQGHMKITNCSFKRNQGIASGGAIRSSGNDKMIVVEYSEFDANESPFGTGITTYNGRTTAYIRNCSFKNGKAGTSGGGISTGFTARSEVSNCIFDNNNARFGAGIFCQNDGSSTKVTNCAFSGNFAETAGGAINSSNGSQLEVNNCIFEGNQSLRGGAINTSGDSVGIASATFMNSIFNFNIAEEQGGAFNIGNFNTTITNCQLTNNAANGPGTGGGISFNASDSIDIELKISNSTFAGNTGVLAAGIAAWTDAFTNAHVSLTNTILSHGLESSYAVEEGNPTVSSMGGNFVTDQTLDAVLDPETDQSGIGLDPKFIDEFDFDYHLLDDSPCVNAGVSDGAPMYDLEGNPRLGRVDIGAFENQHVVSVKDNLVDNLHFSISPNPSMDVLNISIENKLKGELICKVIDLKGSLIHCQKWTKSSDSYNNTIHVTDFPDGLYQLILVQGDKFSTTNFIKE